MNFTFKNCRIIIDYSFVLVVSFSALFSAEKILYLLLFSSVHELSHLIALLIVGGKADSIKLSFYGIALNYSCKIPRLREFIVIASGPISNLILFLLFKDDINLTLFLLNIFPVYPLDGGRILDLFSYRLSAISGKIFLVVILLISLYLIIFYKSFSLFLISVYLIFYSINY